MGLYQRNGKGPWYYDVYDEHGIRRRRSTGTDDYKRAEKVEAKVKTEIFEGKWFDMQKAKSITFSQLVEKYMSKYKRQRDPYTKKHLLEFFGDMSLAHITSDTVEDYVLDRDDSEEQPRPATIYQEYALGRRIFNVARKRWKLVKENPFSDVAFTELLSLDNKRDRSLSIQEEEALLAHASPTYLKQSITFAIHTGCRRGEILSIDWKANIDMRQKLIRVPISKRKPTEETRYKVIPMSDRLHRMLLEMSKTPHISGRLFPVTVSALKDAFDRAVINAGLEDFHFHDLRHTFGTRLAQMGVPLTVIKELMGHRTIKTTERYIHHYPADLRPSMKSLDEYYSHNLVTDEKVAVAQ